jgi:uncharacterized SAM-binding protein YcdF (DUF218 family)
MLTTIKILTWLAMPLGILAWSVLLGLFLRWKLKRKLWGSSLILLGIAQLFVFASPTVSDQLLESLENQARHLAAQSQQANRVLEGKRYSAIIVLGGSMKPANAPRRPYPDMGDAADRVWHAARLYRQGLAPRILVSGGHGVGLESQTDLQTESQAMRALLIDFGVPENAIVMEQDSRTTRENAGFTRQLIGDQRAALITSAFHMPRAMRNFQREGVSVDAFPTDFQVDPSVEPLWQRLLPSANAMGKSEAALKEHLALLIRY